MSLLPHEEYIVDVLTLLALNATARATASAFDGDVDVDVLGNQESAFVVVLTASDATTAATTATAITTTTATVATTPTVDNNNNSSNIINSIINSTMAGLLAGTNGFASAFIATTSAMTTATSLTATTTLNALAAAATITTTTATNATITTNKIRYNADIWLIPCYSIILLFAVVGNVLVITTLLQNRRMRTITNVFLLNLAISDILLGVLCMPVTLVGTLLRHFIFGEVLCKLFQFSQAASVAVSSWTLVAISCERYYAICHPLRSRTWQTLSHAYKIIAFIWLGSVLCMTPIALFSQLMPTSRQGMRKCREQWPKDALAYERSYNIFLDLVLLILPLLVLCAAYILITRTLYVSMQNERAINFGNSGGGSSPAIGTSTAMANINLGGSSGGGNSAHSQCYYYHHNGGGHGKCQAYTATTDAASSSSNFSLTFRWHYRGASGSCSTNSSNTSSSAGSGGSGVRGGGAGSDCCCRIADCACAKQFYYYDDVSSRSVGFAGGIMHKRRQLSAPQHRQQRHLYGMRSASIRSLNRSNIINDDHHHCMHNGNGNGSGNGSGSNNNTNICHMTAAAAAAVATTTTSCSSLPGIATALTPITIAAPKTTPVPAPTPTPTTTTIHNNHQTMIVTNLMVQQPQRYKLHAQRQPAQLHDGGERYKMVAATTMATTTTTAAAATTMPGMRITDTTLRRTNTTKNLESKRRVVKMMFVLVLEFFICWTPLYVINTVAMFIGPAIYEYVDYTSISFFQLLAYSSSCCNPITYCFMNASFRRAFLDTFRGGLPWMRSRGGAGGGGGGRFKRHRRSRTETSLSAAGNSITLANSGATLLTTNTLLDSPRL